MTTAWTQPYGVMAIRRDRRRLVRLGVVAALLVHAGAMPGRRRLPSAAPGEGLVLGPRTTVFDHVQRMPVTFFTRTRTAVLVSRLNGEVISGRCVSVTFAASPRVVGRAGSVSG
ncbi:hypothetical protein ACFUYG_23105, partial [Streptomyces sp. NPDC057386]